MSSKKETVSKGSERTPAEQAEELAAINKSLQAEILERKRAEEVSRGQSAALAKTVALLAAEPELDEFIGKVLQVIAEQLEARSATLWFFDEERQEVWMHLNYSDGRVRSPEEMGHPHGSGRVSIGDLPGWPFASSIKESEPCIVDDVSWDPALREWGEKWGIKTWLGIPLVFGDRTVGILTANSAMPNSFRPQTSELIRTLAHQVTLAVEMTRLATKKQQSAVLEERNRIAREIHDTLAQGFTGVVIQLEAAKDVFTEEPEESHAHISRAQELARKGLTEARRSMWALRPSALQRSGLTEALDSLIREASDNTSIDIQLSVEGTLRTAGPEVEFNLLRVAQEAISNAIRHGRPSKVEVRLALCLDHVHLDVKDDGEGFESTGRKADGFGLIGMRERVERLGGELTIQSEPGSGTSVRVNVPNGQKEVE